MQPETQYATVGNDRVAYQVIGEGPRDIVYTTGFWSHLDIEWEEPRMARFFRRLASFSRLIRFDRRGTGLSDRPSEVSSSEVERWLQDCAAVLDAVGSTAATIGGDAFRRQGDGHRATGRGPRVPYGARHPDGIAPLLR